MWDVSPTLVRYDVLEPPSVEMLKLGLSQLANVSATASSTAMRKPISDFYRTDPISRASVTMAACSKAFTHKDYPMTLTDDSGSAQVISSHALFDLADRLSGCICIDNNCVDRMYYNLCTTLPGEHNIRLTQSLNP